MARSEFAKMFSKKPPNWQLAIEDCPLFSIKVDVATGFHGEQWTILNRQLPMAGGGFSNFLLETQIADGPGEWLLENAAFIPMA